MPKHRKLQKLLPGCLQPPPPAAAYSGLTVSSEDDREGSSLHPVKNQESGFHLALPSTRYVTLNKPSASFGLNFES